ncbi:hypothetical protein PB01_17160 [Psychrobacillus glaciei]|uniref:Condensation domain-containing protein n=1 Tax=Psychrobacillus glaciei TaxID=2283160 RepID=A0A5J6SSA4_9BACI|nr:condensation domain-containing protein [Psychrobacillus glaciei]QFG00394.1 hypothetical protein PB01_17160 [Psychrobacillus glaciei]
MLGLYPVSSRQRQLWFLNKLDTYNAAYNIPFAFRMIGNLNLDYLQIALNKIVGRHEVFRTSFHESEDGEPFQKIASTEGKIMEVIDLLKMSNLEQKLKIEETFRKEADFQFDLTEGSLYFFKLIILSKNEHIFYANIHHIIFDQWSYNIFTKELRIIYNSLIRNDKLELPNLPIQYIDYSSWEIGIVNETEFKEQINYWKEKLGGSLTNLEIPLDFPRKINLSSKSNTYSFELPCHFKKGIEKLSREESATIYMSLLSIFKVLLYKYTNETDIIIGTPTSGRDYGELENLIGFFVNTLAIRSKLDPSQSFRQFLKQVRGNCIEAFSNNEVPFEKLVKEVNPHRVLGYNPLFQIMFNYKHLTNETVLNLESVKTESITMPKGEAKYDFSFLVTEGSEMKVTIEYNVNIFKREKIINISEYFLNIIKQVINNPDLDISSITTFQNIDKEYSYGLTPTPGQISLILKSSKYKDNLVEIFESSLYPKKIFILNKDMQPVPPDVPGNLFIGIFDESHIKVFNGNYYKNGDGFFYKTQEIYKVNHNKELQHIAHERDIAKFKGFKINLQTVKDTINNQPGVVDTKVVFKKDDKSTFPLHAYISINNSFEGEKTFKKKLKRILHKHMIPKILIIDIVPEIWK